MRTSILAAAPLTFALALTAADAQGRSAATNNQPSAYAVADTTLRRAVGRHFPAALAGRMGRRPAVWFAADGNNRVLKSAAGNAELAHGLTWRIAARKLTGVPQSAQPGDLLQWGKVAVAKDTVDVIWVRLKQGRLEPADSRK